MATAMKIQGRDIPIEDLLPLQERSINLKTNRGFLRIEASIKAVGLIQCLCVCEEKDKYVILDGWMRYKACQRLGVKMVPCMIFPDKEAYTYNRMVCKPSPMQEARMLRESLKTVDESTIAEVLGMKSISYRIGAQLTKQLDARIIKALDDDLLTRTCAAEFTHVKPARQAQIMKELERNNDYSVSFVRALVVKTPPDLRIRTANKRNPWSRDAEKKKALVTKLEEVEKRHDFYTRLYRQYTTDLLRLSIFVRKLVTNDKVRDYLTAKHAEILTRFEGIVLEVEGKKAS